MEQIALLAGLDDEITLDTFAELDSERLIDLGEKGEGRFIANLTPKGAAQVGMVEVGPIPGVDPSAPFAPRKFLPSDNVRWWGTIRFVFDGTAPAGCLGCGGHRSAPHAYCIVCEPLVVMGPNGPMVRRPPTQQVPLVRSAVENAQPHALGPRKHRLAAKKMKNRH